MTLPAPDVRQRVLHPNPLPELLSAFRRLLALPQLLQQTLVGMDAHAPASVLALGASRSQGPRCANLLREAHHPANLEGHRDTRRAAQQPSLPVQSAQYVTFSATEACTLAFPAVTHLRVFHRNEPFARYAADQFGRLPRRLLHVLLAHAPGDPDLRLSFASRSTLQILLHGIECLQYPPERHRPLLRIVPIAVQSRLEASRVRDHRRPGLLSPLRQPPPLLARDHAQRFLQGVSQ